MVHLVHGDGFLVVVDRHVGRASEGRFDAEGHPTTAREEIDDHLPGEVLTAVQVGEEGQWGVWELLFAGHQAVPGVPVDKLRQWISRTRLPGTPT